VLVKQQLRIAIDIERSFRAAVLFVEYCARAVYRGRRCVNERYSFAYAVIEYVDGVLVICRQHVAAIPFRGYGRGPLMEYGVGSLHGPALQFDRETVFVPIGTNVAVDEITEFVPVAEIVDNDDIGESCTIQAPNQVAANKTSAASDDDHETVMACCRLPARSWRHNTDTSLHRRLPSASTLWGESSTDTFGALGNVGEDRLQ